MLKLYITLFVCYFIITRASAERRNDRSNSNEIAFLVKEYFLTMLKLCIVLFGWYLMVVGISAERVNKGNNSMEIPFLDKQHDYNLTFERVEPVRYDKRYMKYLNLVTTKYKRTCPVVNGSLMCNLDVGYDLEVVTQMYRFASNEYRLIPARFQFNFCQAVEKNTLGLGTFRNCGTFTGCPIVKGKNYSICNWGPNPAMFHPFIPSGQYMFELQVMFGSLELFVVRGYAKIFRPIPGSE